MTKSVCVFQAVLMSALAVVAAGPAQAQHLHRHGDHFDVHRNVPHGHDGAGHLVDRYGHHIDGHGHHTGSVGVYENGSYSLPYSQRWSGYSPSYSSLPYYASPYYSSPLYSGSLYSGSLYSGSLYSGSLYGRWPYAGSLYSGSAYGNPLYSAPQYSLPGGLNAAAGVLPSAPGLNAAPLNAAPLAAAPLAANGARNKIPLPQAAPAARGGSFVLTNPLDSGGPIQYSLNTFAYTIKPGESQRVELDRDWVITFDNGLNKTVTYRLEDGVYDFTVSPDTGWDLMKRKPQVAPSTAVF